MLNFQKGARFNLTPQSVRNDVRISSGGKHIHEIIFHASPATDKQPYIAEEANDSLISSFIIEKSCDIEVSNCGGPNKLDWIRFLGMNATGAPPIPRDKLDIAKLAFASAVQMGVKFEWSEEEIMEKAYSYSLKIQSLAQII